MVTPGIDALGSRADRDVNLSLVAEAGFFACPNTGAIARKIGHLGHSRSRSLFHSRPDNPGGPRPGKRERPFMF